MSGSHPDGKLDTLKFAVDNNVKTILDVGAGKGMYYDALEYYAHKRLHQFDALEVWEPYIKKYDLLSKYDNVYIEDVRAWDNFNYDLVILGDVLEHMTKEEAIEVWSRICKQAKYAVISIPIIHYPQGESEGNPYQVHVKEDWTTKEVLETFDHIVDHIEYKVVGVFFAQFNN